MVKPKVEVMGTTRAQRCRWPVNAEGCTCGGELGPLESAVGTVVALTVKAWARAHGVIEGQLTYVIVVGRPEPSGPIIAPGQAKPVITVVAAPELGLDDRLTILDVARESTRGLRDGAASPGEGKVH